MILIERSQTDMTTNCTVPRVGNAQNRQICPNREQMGGRQGLAQVGPSEA